METNKDKIYTWSDSEQQKADELGEEVAQDWIKKVSSSGADGQSLYNAWIDRLQKYEDKIAK